MGAGETLGQTPRRLVLADVARLEPRGDDLLDARRAQRAPARGGDDLPFLERQRVETQPHARESRFRASPTGIAPNFTTPLLRRFAAAASCAAPR